MSKIQEIAQGWFNAAKDALGILTPEIKQMSEERLAICSVCPIRTDDKCDPSKSLPAVQDFIYTTNFGTEKRFKDTVYTGCSCPISKKILSPLSSCPVGKFLDTKQQKEKDGN